MTISPLWPSFLAGFTLFAGNFELGPALRKVESRYNSVRTLQVDYRQEYSFSAQPLAKRSESGVLFLQRPGKMRWEYREPAGKLFLSDGKTVYFYIPSSNRVERSRLKETEDLRAPLAFLLGRLDFDRDFRQFRVRPSGQDHWIEALPKSAKAAYRQVDFLLTPSFQISRLRIYGQDQSIMDYTFSNERLNPILNPKLFVFEPPQGAEVVDLEQP
ncbi:MAG: outer membrane lipoprotein chaperone LolA [Bryobacteraceae bacterium]|nr:outer membrane lipoprotein chaperone LolA [Bryobacteraceae bacterium]MDW8380020.1 outer membrane lipoprotein chaperone LolA [Bryobacterales bacterium]